ncbi:MAG: hypothetical protein KGL39_45210 [Patescibacteria group bacterium]|nr:hypothetical protein [Patescibacteria group bacterium]
MTQPQLERTCRIWQKRLRLVDWDVTAVLVPAEQMEDFGETIPDETELRAGMKIRDCEEAEATVIHELLHLRLLPFDAEDQDQKETAINLLADCFMRAYPKRKRANAIR